VVDTNSNLVREVNRKTRKPSLTQKMINTTDKRSGRTSTKKEGKTIEEWETNWKSHRKEQ